VRNVVVTGGAGFIGSELVRQLVQGGADVTVLDSLVNGRRENLGDVLGARCRLVVADVREGETVAALLRDVDTVFHLACLGVRHSIHSPLENHEVNATATLRCLTAARAAGVRRFVQVSSSEVYGTARQAPMTEDHPTFPATVYGASKLAGEALARAFHETYGFPAVVLRPFNVYGPRSHHEGDCGEVIPRFLLRGLAGRPLVIFGDGAQTRDFSFVSDTARAIVAAGTRDHVVGRTINIGSGQEISIAALAAEIGHVLGRRDLRVVHDRPRPGDVRRLHADPATARTLLGHAAEVSLRQGLARLRDWYLGLPLSPGALLEQERLHNWEPA
jgi:UDP-glucose 4-epimerase